jgi:hypothetical protein
MLMHVSCHKIYIAKFIIIKPHYLAMTFKSTSTLCLDIILALTM